MPVQLHWRKAQKVNTLNRFHHDYKRGVHAERDRYEGPKDDYLCHVPVTLVQAGRPGIAQVWYTRNSHIEPFKYPMSDAVHIADYGQPACQNFLIIKWGEVQL